MQDPFENDHTGCPWFIERKVDDNPDLCKATGDLCLEENCAPYYWAEEIAGRIWASADVRIRRD
jgi:hypothetical protein